MIGPRSWPTLQEAVSALAPPPGVRVWFACHHTDMRKGRAAWLCWFKRCRTRIPFGGALFAVHGKRGGLVRLLSFDDRDRRPTPDGVADDGAMAIEALFAHVLSNKYSDHLPLNRQSQSVAREGVALDRSTRVGRPCSGLVSLHVMLLRRYCPRPLCPPAIRPRRCSILAGERRKPDGSGARRSINGHGGDGTFGGGLPSRCDQKGEHPASHLKNFRGLLQTDRYTVKLTFC